MKSIFDKNVRKKENEDTITIVSGLPRSGTSMMMQMLEAGGIPVVTDGIRMADESNPKGYYEFEKVKKITKDTSWLDGCRGKVFKMVSMLLYHLPDDKRYEIIFMQREMKEILTSQSIMLNKLGRKGAEIGRKEMAAKYKSHLRNVENWLAEQENINVIYMNYNIIIQKPFESAQIVNQFLNNRLNVEKMAGVVEKKLYRQRKSQNLT